MASWLASPKSLQKEYIAAIKKTKPTYILYESNYFKVDDISMSKSLLYSNVYQLGLRADSNERTLLMIDGVEENVE